MHVASNSSGAVEYYHVDHLGSTRLKTNSTGGVIYESNYEPYGPGCGETGSENHRYTGKREDPTGLYYYGARYYDPVTGRFTTRDTVSGRLVDPQSLNRYVYCRNNPHKYVDPDGKWMHIAAGALIGGGLNFAFYCMTHGDDFKTNQAARARLWGEASTSSMDTLPYRLKAYSSKRLGGSGPVPKRGRTPDYCRP